MDIKYCKKCYKYLELKCFHKSKSRSYLDGHISVCKSCIKNKVVLIRQESIFKIVKGNFIIDFDNPDTPLQEDTVCEHSPEVV